MIGSITTCRPPERRCQESVCPGLRHSRDADWHPTSTLQPAHALSPCFPACRRPRRLPLSSVRPLPRYRQPSLRRRKTPPPGRLPRRRSRRAAPAAPYSQVITDRAHTEHGGITVHRVDEQWFFEVPDSLLNRDILFVVAIGRRAGRHRRIRVRRQRRSRGAWFAGAEGQRSHQPREHQLRRGRRRLAADRDQRAQQQLLADPRARSRFRRSRATARGYVIDVTDFFGGDTPGISGLSAAQRRQYQVRRLDPARSYVSSVRSFPINVEVRQVQTFDAAEPPGDRSGGTISLEMRQSMILLPKVPMRPRMFDERVGYFTVRARQLRPRRAEGRDGDVHHALAPRAEGSGGVRARRAGRADQADRLLHRSGHADQVAPLREGRRRDRGRRCSRKPASRTRFSPRIRRRKTQDPDWDPDDARYSMVRWAASLVRNAVGPEHARSAQRRDHQQRDHVVPQPHAVVSQPPDDRDGRGESRRRARSTFPKS